MDVTEKVYPWTSGHMLHLEGCTHFGGGKPPRLATEKELRTLPLCSTCSGITPVRKAPAASRRAPVIADDRFTCAGCFVSHPAAMRSEGGLCRACAD